MVAQTWYMFPCMFPYDDQKACSASQHHKSIQSSYRGNLQINLIYILLYSVAQSILYLYARNISTEQYTPVIQIKITVARKPRTTFCYDWYMFSVYFGVCLWISVYLLQIPLEEQSSECLQQSVNSEQSSKCSSA